MADAPKVIHFHSGALAEDTLLVHMFTGQERISRPYSYDLELVSKKADIDFGKVLKEPVYVGIKAPVRLRDGGFGNRLLKISGMLSFFQQEEKKYEWVRYRAVLVPRLWKLSLTIQSRVFQDKDVKQIVEQVLKDAGFATTDFEFKTTGSYKPREYVVQYQESDLDFINRWLEHEGIFYFFDQTDEGEKIIFGDSTSAYAALVGGAKVPYRPIAEKGGRVAEEGATDWFAEEVIQSFSSRHSVIPKEVVLNDYNWRKPADSIKVEATVHDDGVGKVYNYADHYKDTGEGKALAKVRAEEIKCRRAVFMGASDHKAFRAGTKFTLADHYRDDFNTDYLITDVRTRAAQALGLPWSTVIGTTFGNEWSGILASETFRPLRETPWPSIHGVINAKVDGGGSEQYAEIDDAGRYKVKLPFDLSDKKDGKASRFIRMAQPYSGKDFGMHFPLHKGAEVILTFVDGDPDRPIISAAVPNPDTSSPVKGGNHTQCVIKTGSDNKIVIEDTSGGERIRMSTPHSSTYLSLGAPNAGGNVHLGTDGKEIREIGTDTDTTIGANLLHAVGGSEVWDTTGNVARTIGGHLRQAVTGFFNHTVSGYQATLVHGLGRDVFLGGKNEVIGPWKMEYVFGANTGIVTGVKTDIIGGATILLHKGVAYEKAPADKKEAATAKELYGILKSDIGSVARKVSGAVKDKMSDLHQKISANARMKACMAKFEAEDKLHAKGGSQVKLEAPVVKITADAKVGGDQKVSGSLDVKNKALQVP